MNRLTQAAAMDRSAAVWLIRMVDGTPSIDDRKQYTQWMASNARHRAVYRRLETAWRRADRLQWLRPLDGSVNDSLLSDGNLLRHFGIRQT
jgi:ferric-dicitrate binding protein FerR (iron transport regulator)